MMRFPLFVLLFASAAGACVWSHGTNLRGEAISINAPGGADWVEGLNDVRPRSFWEKELRKLQEAGGTRTLQQRNDEAVILLHLGETKRAIEILVQLESEQPGLYATAANLGTAYELAGDDESALRWIRESIVRNRNAHYGSEWLHVRILEAKLAMRNDSRWLDTHSIIGVDSGPNVIPRRHTLPKGNNGKLLTVDGVKDALRYQLSERYEFVRPPDAIVGSLLFDWANLVLLTETLESAVPLYREALRYGTPRRELATKRLRLAEQKIRASKQRAR